MSQQFERKTVLVTGPGSGIGRATALAFAREGARVAVSDVVEQGVMAMVAEIEAQGGTAAAFTVDVTHAPEVGAAINGVSARWGRSPS